MKSKLKKEQIRMLKLLGYEDTQEDGAVLQHPDLYSNLKYVWYDETFEEVLESYTRKLKESVRIKITSNIRNLVI
jgi:hypothetical protein